MADTLLALLLRPLMLDTGSVKGIVPPSEACGQVRDKSKIAYPKGRVAWRCSKKTRSGEDG
jgi:hypothetical protein